MEGARDSISFGGFHATDPEERPRVDQLDHRRVAQSTPTKRVAITANGRRELKERKLKKKKEFKRKKGQLKMKEL